MVTYLALLPFKVVLYSSKHDKLKCNDLSVSMSGGLLIHCHIVPINVTINFQQGCPDVATIQWWNVLVGFFKNFCLLIRITLYTVNNDQLLK